MSFILTVFELIPPEAHFQQISKYYRCYINIQYIEKWYYINIYLSIYLPNMLVPALEVMFGLLCQKDIGNVAFWSWKTNSQRIFRKCDNFKVSWPTVCQNKELRETVTLV